MTIRSLRMLGAGALSLSIAGSAATPGLALSPVSQPGDAPPSSDACAALGFAPPAPERGRVGTIVSAAKRAPPAIAEYRSAPSPTMMTPPPPLPIPPVSRSMNFEPPVRDTERYPGAVANPIKRVADEPVSTFSIDVDTAAYANVRRFLNDGGAPPRDAVRVEELVNYFDYGYARPTSAGDAVPATVAVTPSPWSARSARSCISACRATPPRAPTQPPLNLVFLVDTSGSMMGQDRLPLARKALNVLIDQLRPSGPRGDGRLCRLGGSGAGADRRPLETEDALRPRGAAGRRLDGRRPGPETGLRPGQAELRPRPVNRVILVTDGDFNVGITDPSRLKDFVADQRKSGVYLSVYGFGRGNYNDTMMQALAQNGNGVAAYVDTLQRGPQAAARRLPGQPVPDRRRREDPGRVQSGPVASTG
jgi:Ca-activated chloride channel family protein